MNRKNFRVHRLLMAVAFVSVLSCVFLVERVGAIDRNSDLIYAPDTVNSGPVDEKIFEKLPETAVLPMFNNVPGTKEFSTWVYSNIRYPQEAYENDIQGKVVVSFIVDKDGKVRDVTIVESVHELLDNEVVKLVSSSPLWKPGKIGDEAVNVRFTFPVIFSISGNNR